MIAIKFKSTGYVYKVIEKRYYNSRGFVVLDNGTIIPSKLLNSLIKSKSVTLLE